jgi:fibronectin type 3 domain-containing protein
LGDLLGFRVFRQSHPLTPSSCPDCPLDFQVVAEIDVEYPREAQVEGGRVLWPDTSLKPQQEYTYFVLAYNSYKCPSPESNRVKIFWDQAPPAPVEVRIKTQDRALEITWEFSLPPGKELAGFAGFNVYRRMERERFGFYPLNPDPIKQARFVDGGLENGRRYGYEVRAVRNFRGTLIEGPASGVVEGIPEKQTPPSPPTGVVGVFQEGGVSLRWDGSPEPDIAGYDVYRREGRMQTFHKINPQLVKEPYFLDRAASPLKSYSYRLKAVDSSGRESEFSKEAEVFPEPTTTTE